MSPVPDFAVRGEVAVPPTIEQFEDAACDATVFVNVPPAGLSDIQAEVAYLNCAGNKVASRIIVAVKDYHVSIFTAIKLVPSRSSRGAPVSRVDRQSPLRSWRCLSAGWWA